MLLLSQALANELELSGSGLCPQHWYSVPAGQVQLSLIWAALTCFHAPLTEFGLPLKWITGNVCVWPFGLLDYTHFGV